jgi:hypothetical protein
MSSASAWSPSLGPVHASPFSQAVVRAMRKLYVFFLFILYYAYMLHSAYISLAHQSYRYPESLADKTFDNTGCEHSLGHLGYFVQGGFSFGIFVRIMLTWRLVSVLLEAPLDSLYPLGNSVLLTVDLTRSVALEAIVKEASVIIAYRM